MNVSSENECAEKTFALQVVERLRAAGFEALWAGGCVRDLLLGREPTDYDVATSATPQQVRELFGRNRTLAVGMSFGVMIVLAPERAGGQVEVATFRTDAQYSDGRHPDAVIFSTAAEDAQRRDFTINGMFYDPLQDSVIDYVGGQADLERGMIRAIGRAEERIGEDKLRMLRGVRFAARFGFELEAGTRKAIARHAAEVACVSGERIWSEIVKTLQTPRSAWAVEQWRELGLLAIILPAVDAGWQASGQHVIRMLAVAEQVQHVVANDELDKFLAMLWAIVGSESEPLDGLINSLKVHLKIANKISQAIGFCLSAQSVFDDAQLKPWSQLQPWLVDPLARRAVRLFAHRAGETTAERRATLAWLEQQLTRPSSELDPAPLLMGDDLIAAGLEPCPLFRQLLDQARILQLDAQLGDRAAALQWLSKRVSEKGSDPLCDTWSGSE